MNSNDKGKSYERKIAKILSEWSGIELIRTPMSGAWAGTSGDIIPKEDNTDFPFLIECKKNEDWTLERIFTGKSALFNSWLEQIYAECKKDYELTSQHRFPLLIFSRNRHADYLLFPLSLMVPTAIDCFSSVLSIKYSGNVTYFDVFFIVLLDEYVKLDFKYVADRARELNLAHFGDDRIPTTVDDI